MCHSPHLGRRREHAVNEIRNGIERRGGLRICEQELEKQARDRGFVGGEFTGDYEVGNTGTLGRSKKYRLGDNAAGSASAVGVNGGGSSRLSVGSIGSDGEESSEEIH